MNRDEVEKKAKLTAHEIVLKWSKILIGLNKTNGAAMGSDIATAIYEEAIPRLTLEQRNRELEGEVESWQQAQSIFRQENLRLHADKAQRHADLEQAQEEIGRLKEAVKVQTLQAIAWTHAEACVALNEGQDLHQVFVPGLLERFYREMEPPHAD